MEQEDKINNYLAKIAKTINSVRYGNLSARLEDVESPYPAYKEVVASINRMIETLGDREKMIIEYQNELKQQIDKEKEIKALKEDFAAALTHDLKVPVIAQANVVDFLLEGKFGEINEKQRTALQNIQTSSRELLELVHTLLETYKFEKVKPVKEKINLNEFITGVVDEMQPPAAHSGIKIGFLPGNTGEIPADPQQIERVLKNLISNAILHSGTKKDIEITAGRTRGFVKICVTDYGAGIAPEKIKNIFEKYYHTGKKFRKINSAGSGLGLYFSQQLVQAHGGEITVKSKPNVRTEFCIKLPVAGGGK